MKKFFHIFLSILITSQLLVSVLSNRAIAAGSNLITNQSVEQLSADGVTPSGWASSSWGTNTPSFSYKPVGQNGTKSIYLKLSNYVDGDAKWYFNPVAVTPNTKYIFSDFYKSDVSSEVVAELTSSSGVVSYQWLGTLSPSAAWKKAGFYMTTKPDTAKVTVLHLLSSNGYLQTDNYSFATATQGTASQGIINNSFEQSDDIITTQPLGWQQAKWGNNTATFTRPKTGGYSSNSFGKVTVSNYVDGDAKWMFDSVSVTPGVKYVASNYYKSNVSTNVVAQFTSTTGVTSYQWLGTQPASTTWKLSGYYVTPPAGTAKATILHVLAANGYLSTDNYRLMPATSATIANGVPNGSVEQTSDLDSSSPIAWSQGKWGTNNATFSYQNAGYTGTRSLKVEMTNYTDGDAKWLYDSQPVVPNKDYRFTAFYKATTTGHAAVMFTHANGSVSYFGMHNAENSTNWSQYTDTFTTPATAVSATIFFYISGVGYFMSDDYSVSNYSYIGFDKPRLSLTFDDGWEENVDTLLPRLNAYGFKSTQYYATQHITETNDPSGVIAFNNSNHELGSHTITHPNLSVITLEQVIAELTGSQDVLEGIVNKPVRNFASPYGGYNAAAVNEIKKLYRSHRTVDEGYNSKDNFDIYRLKVQNVLVDTPPAKIQEWITKSQQDNTWLILVYHRISNNAPGPYDSRIADFDQHLVYIQNSGISVQTVEQALNELEPQL